MDTAALRFELPPALPEKRAKPARRIPPPDVSPKPEAQGKNGASAGHKREATPPPVPQPSNPSQHVQYSEGEEFSPAGLTGFSVALPKGVIGLTIVGFIILGIWLVTPKSPTTGTAERRLPRYVPDSMPTPTPPSITYATPTPMPTISMRPALPTISATPTPSVMRASLLYHVVNVANGDYLYIHSGAGAKFPVVGRLAAGAGNISSTGKTRKNGNTTWLFISAESISGWVNADFLQPGDAKVNPSSPTPSALKSPPISEAEERAKYWESRGYHFNPDFYTAYSMDQKVIDIDRAKYWESRGYHFNPDFYTAYSMDQKVIDIDRAKYWESRGYHFNPDFYTAYSMDLEVEQMKHPSH
jgi:hypothetical protein